MNFSKIALCTVLATAILTPTLRSEPAETKEAKRAKIHAMIKDRETAHMAFDEMLKDKENKRYMAKALAKDKDFRAFYNTEVGNDGPHEERTPSQHPELFRSKQ